jgi:hypothetical protein
MFAVGIVSGLMTLVRHVNVLFPAALVLTFAIRSWRRQEAGWPGGRLALVTAAVTILLVLPQLALYKAATGHWIVSSYGDLGFTFLNPHFTGVLISPRKGLFFWAPILLLALPGLFLLPQRLRDVAAPLAIALIVDTYLIASWWDWQFGGSFGHRAFVDVYPAFALGLAATYSRLGAATPHVRRTIATCVICLCALSLFQMLQYWHGVLPISDMTWTQYKAAFLRFW